MSQASFRKVLVLFPSADVQKQWEDQSFDLADKVVKKCTFDKFQEGTKFDTFDAVILFKGETDDDELELQQEFYQWYNQAPITYIAGETGEDAAKNMNYEVHEDFPAALAAAEEKWSQLIENEVRPAFNEFDADSSGAIDRNELAELMTKLSINLSEEQLQDAFADLDMNNDGVIDFEEFQRWYFTGMRPYNGTRKSIIKMSGKINSLIDKVANEARLAIMEQELKTKTNRFSFSFNAPENPQTIIDQTILIGGQEAKSIEDNLVAQYKDTIDPAKEVARFGEGSWRADDNTPVFVQFSVKTAEGKAADHVKTLTERVTKMIDTFNVKEAGDFIWKQPKIHALDENTIAVGVKAYIPCRIPNLPQDILDVLRHAEQSVNVRAELGTSLSDIMNLEDSLVNRTKDGFRIQASMSVISNLKKLLMELSNSENEQFAQFAQMGMMAAPATMLSVNANIDLTFDDFDEVLEHPMAGPAQANFDQLFTPVTGHNWKDLIANTKINKDLIPADDDSRRVTEARVIVGLFEEMSMLLSDLANEGDLRLELSVPAYGVVSKTNIRAPGLQQACVLGWQFATIQFNKQLEYML